ncbi:pimeloyl-ACP methyl ester esterase BioH [Candidatus Enterovibrio escicola]|uniref:Pimeloyl-[acyl-carrier protein] methyl ester esterase n=1 Tax=Candidatus Enterovibrio escicola TaxID=1927127 RepID=A0A2A5T4U9_9GAMM|nr:pimeloyl-ACP methyl ester esterase BioH [Candidatus Enterovibrio escacola]PCS23187.1 Biotin synthesis protein BioH [Candidatus Enterovibrio escacola]
MTTSLHWYRSGQGSDMIFIHGWGMNSAVWQHLLPFLTAHYRVHCVDLPGYGYSQPSDALSLKDMVQCLLENSDQPAIWVGWSLGGIVATQVALLAPERVQGLVTVASSPRFLEKQGWRGTKLQVLEAFLQQLSEDFIGTVERFIEFQAMGTLTARQDIEWLKKVVVAHPPPQTESLKAGFYILGHTDLRPRLHELSMPWLQIYGLLDAIVPVRVAQAVNILVPQSQQKIFDNSAHAPFISHPEDFSQVLLSFCGQCLPDFHEKVSQ